MVAGRYRWHRLSSTSYRIRGMSDSRVPSTLIGLIAWPLHPGGSFQEGLFKLSAIGLVATTFFLYVGVFTFPGGAYQFLDYANGLVMGNAAPQAFSRDIGYPLLLIMGGYPATHSFAGITLIQAAMAWAMPLLVHGTVGPQHPKAAYLAGLLTIASLAPYLFMKMIHHDQAYVFFSTLGVFLSARYLRSGTLTTLYLLLGALIAASLTRPAGNLLVVPLLLLMWVYRPSAWKHYLICTVAIAAVFGVYSTHRSRVLGPTAEGESRSYAGRQIFYNLYVNSREFGARFDESLGPATQTLFKRVRDLLKNGALTGAKMREFYAAHGYPPVASEFLFTRYQGRDEEFIAALKNSPNHDYYEFFCLLESNDRVFLDSAIEITRANPLLPLKYFARNLFLFVFSPGFTHYRFHVSTKPFGTEGLPLLIPLRADLSIAQIQTFVPSPGKEELITGKEVGVSWLERTLFRCEMIWMRLYPLFNLFCVAFMGLAVFCVVRYRGKWSGPVSAALLFYLYNAAITCAFAEPNLRYHFFVLPILCVSTGFGLACLSMFMDLSSKGSTALRSWDPPRPPKPPSLTHGFRGHVALLAIAVVLGWGWTYALEHTRLAG